MTFNNLLDSLVNLSPVITVIFNNFFQMSLLVVHPKLGSLLLKGLHRLALKFLLLLLLHRLKIVLLFLVKVN